jgi:hypothetical protein
MANDGFNPGFSIQETMDRGLGNLELLDDFLEPGSQTGNPDNVTKITEEHKDKPEDKKSAPKPKVDEKKQKELEEKKKQEQEDKDKSLKSLDNFLGEDEENKKDEDDENPVKDKNEVDKNTQEDNPYESLSKDLFQLGVFNKDEGEEDVKIDTPEALKDRFDYEGRKKASQELDNFLGQFGDDYKEAFRAIYQNGVDPREYFTTYNKIEDLANLDLTKESNQESVVRQGLTEQGWEAEDVDAEVERLKNAGDLETVSKRHQKSLAKSQAQKLQQLEQDKQNKIKQEQSIKQQYINNVQNVLNDKIKTKDFDGIPVNPKFAQEVQDFLVTEKWKLPSGELLTDFDKLMLDLKRPENHQTKVKLGLLIKLLEKDPNLSTIQKTVATKQADVLFGNTVKKDSSKTNKKEESKTTSWFQ